MFEMIKARLLPQSNSSEVREKMTPLSYRMYFSMTVLYSVLLFAAYGLLGVGSELFSEQLGAVKQSKWEAAKLIFFTGKVTAGLLYPFIYTLFFTIFFWIVCEEHKFLQVWRLLLVPFVIMLFGKTLELVSYILLRIPEHSSPFSLGVLAQYWTNNAILIEILATVTVFVIWSAYKQYAIFYREQGIPKKKVLTVVIFSNLLMILLSAGAAIFFNSMRVWL